MNHGLVLSMRPFFVVGMGLFDMILGCMLNNSNGLQWRFDGFLVWMYGFGVDLALKLAL